MKPYSIISSYIPNIRIAIIARPSANEKQRKQIFSQKFRIFEDEHRICCASSINQPLKYFLQRNYSIRKMNYKNLSLGLTLPLSQALHSVNDRPFTPSPLSSPPSSPTSLHSPSGHFEKVKEAIGNAVEKIGTKASNTSIDNDVKEMCLFYPLLNQDEKYDILLLIALNLSTNHKQIISLVNAMPKSEDLILDQSIQMLGQIRMMYHMHGTRQNPDEGDNPRIRLKEILANQVSNCANSITNDIEALIRWEDKLRQSLQPPYQWLATQVSRLSGGVKFIIDIREDLLNLLSVQSLPRESQTSLKAFDGSLRDLLSLWFTVGLLELQRVTWESPCDLLQKISEYEAVHPMRNWTDLKRRVGNYRRCFIFTHSCMPNEPLVVLHTFLTNGISSSMSKIIQIPRNLSFDDSSMKAGEDSSTITTAIFYSITATQKGLKGIELGNYLIRQVVNELQRELPHLTQFSSLSPIPGFVKWLDINMLKAQRGEIQLFVPPELELIQDVLQVCNPSDVYAELRRMLKTNAWFREEELKTLLESPLMRLCSYYLYLEKRRGYVFDPVANFHLRNGAVMWRINWNADKSPRGMNNSCGIMVNYRYFLEDCEKNSKAYLETYKVTASDAVIYLAKMAQDVINKSMSPSQIKIG